MRSAGSLCQKNEAAVEIKQQPATVGVVGLFTGHLSKLELTDRPICERCLERTESATHMLCDL
jgi:hypothetical protein